MSSENGERLYQRIEKGLENNVRLEFNILKNNVAMEEMKEVSEKIIEDIALLEEQKKEYCFEGESRLN